MDDAEDSKQNIYAHNDDWWHFHEDWFDDWAKLHGTASLGGQNLISTVVTAADVALHETYRRPIAAVACHFHPPMISYGP